MTPDPPPELSFEEWVDYVFDRPVGEPQWFWEWEGDEPLHWYEPEPPKLVAYLTRLFESPGFLAERFTPTQLNQGVWFLFGLGSEWMRVLYDSEVPLEERLRLARSISVLYRELFARMWRDWEDAEDLPGTGLYMMWDMDVLGFSADDPKNAPIDQAQLQVLREALELDCPPCHESALHGLEEASHAYPAEVKRIIDDYGRRSV